MTKPNPGTRQAVRGPVLTLSAGCFLVAALGPTADSTTGNADKRFTTYGTDSRSRHRRWRAPHGVSRTSLWRPAQHRSIAPTHAQPDARYRARRLRADIGCDRSAIHARG